MATQSYYELLQRLAAQQKRQAVWRSQIAQGLEGIRSLLASRLGVEYLRYNDGLSRYVEILAPSGLPFHISAQDVVEQRDGLFVVKANVLESEVGIVPYSCPLLTRYHDGVLEYQVEQYRSHWTHKPEVAVRNIMKALMNSLRVRDGAI